MKALLNELLNAKRYFIVGIAGHRLEMLECESCVKRAKVLAMFATRKPYEARCIEFLNAVRELGIDIERNASLRELLDADIATACKVVDDIVFYDL